MIESAPWLPPKTSRHAVVRAEAKSLARGLALRLDDGRRDRSTGHEVAIALVTGDREGKADPPRAAGEHAVGEAEVAVRLGEDERQAKARGSNPAGAAT